MDSTTVVNLVRTLNETSIWDKVYVISNCVIALFAIFALIQFRFSKKESNRRTQREKALLSTELIEYLRDILHIL